MYIINSDRLINNAFIFENHFIKEKIINAEKTVTF